MADQCTLSTNHNASFRKKLAVSLVFGIAGFLLNFLHFQVATDSRFVISMLPGIVFALFISLVWGWRWGLAACLAGGTQSMWWIWANDGWGLLYAVPVFTLWVLWHGLWKDIRSSREKSPWYFSPFAVELPFRLVMELGFFTVFPWLVSFNPPFWNEFILTNTVPPLWIYHITIKHVLCGYLYLLTAVLVLQFRRVRRFFGLPFLPGQDQRSLLALSAFLLVGLLWIGDGVLEYFFFNSQGRGLGDLLFFQMCPRDLFIRGIFTFLLFGAGLAMGQMMGRRAELRRELALTNRKLQQEINLACQFALEAQEANKTRQDFLMRVNHEMRTPLHGIMGMGELLEETDLDEEQRVFLENIRENSELLYDIVGKVLDFSSVEKVTAALEVRRFEPEALMRKLHEKSRETAVRKGLSFRCSWPRQMPSALRGDVRKIRQILENLLDNAFKFTPSGSVELTLEVNTHTLASGERELYFSVSDTGIGIPEAMQERIFEEYQKVRTGPKFYTGAGLGLTICRSFVTMMGGSMGVESVEKEGSRFWFSVPVETAEENGEEPRNNTA